MVTQDILSVIIELKMKIKHLHYWDVSPKEAANIQRNLACKIRLNCKIFLPQFVAGADISFSKGTTAVYAGVIILSLFFFPLWTSEKIRRERVMM